MRVADEIRRTDATEIQRDAAYARAGALLDSVERAAGVSVLTRFGRGIAALYRGEAALAEADRATSRATRCVVAGRAGAFADSVQIFFPMSSRSPSVTYQALLVRAWEFVRTAEMRAATACE